MTLRKKLLRGISLLCLAAMLLAVVPTAFAYGSANGWFKAELNRMEALGLIPQALQEKDDLRVNITRLEMCTIAVQAFETYIGAEISYTDPAPFQDTDSPIAAKAYAAGLTLGYEDGTFCPDKTLTREEFFTFISHFLTATGWTPESGDFADLSAFSDAGSVSQWALSPTQLAVGIGVVKGDGQSLTPKATTTCEQALAMFYRAYIVLTGEIAEPDPTEPEKPFEEKYPNLDSWAKEELPAMDGQGLIPELLVGRDMKSPITRREMCYVAAQAYLGLNPDTEVQKADSPFTDVDDETITLAYSLGLVNGFPDGTFQPDIAITREQFYRITVNFLGAAGYDRTDSPNTDLSRFSDANQLSDYAKASARLLVRLGIVKGDGQGLAPKASTQCQQALALFFRSYNFLTEWLANSGDRPEATELVDFALQFVGCDYVWGGRDPSTGFDCSGLVYYVYRHFGYPVGRTATDQWYYKESWEVSLGGLRPGDLVFFSPTGSEDDITHVGIYVGDDQFLHAANSARGVVVDSIDNSYFTKNFLGARRILP